MAKKTRTPPPPRPVQAPQRRKGKSGKPGSTDNRNKWLLIAFAASGVVGLAAVAAVIALASGGGGTANAADVPAAMKAAGCTFTTKKATSREHVSDPDAKIKYNTTPPTNGKHYFSPATWGFFFSAANPTQVVHNEEHGGVILWWGDKVPVSTIDKLHDFYSSSPNGMLGTPYPTLGNKIAITAWSAPEGENGEGRVAVCSTFDEKAFTAFRDAFRGKGPERFPLDTLTPGA